MAVSFRFQGADALRAVGQALKEAGEGKELKKGLSRELRAAGKPAAEDMRAELAKALPKSGGLSASLTKRKFSVLTRLTGAARADGHGGAGVRISTTKKHQYTSLEDTGILRHPVFADGEETRSDWLWVAQSVSGAKGALTDTFDEHIPEFVNGVQRALDQTLDSLDRAMRRAE